jgi:hypothetical protein
MPVALGLVDLGLLLALAVLIGLSWAYRYTLGAVIVATAGLIGSIRLPGFLGGGRVLGFAADALTKVDHQIRYGLGVAIENTQHAWNEAVSYTALAVHWIGKEIASLSHDAGQALHRAHVTSVTNVYRRANPALVRKVGALAGVVAALTTRVAHLAEREARFAKSKAIAVEHAIAVPDIGAIPRALPGVGRLDREARRVRNEIKRLARYLTPAGIIGLVGVTTFNHFGLGWLRCKGVGRVGRSLCGASGLIEALYAGTLAAFAVTDLCRFAYGIERVAESMRPLMLEWVDVETALLKCPAASYPHDFALPHFVPTPVIDAVAL